MTVWDDARTLIGQGETETAIELIETFLQARQAGKHAKRVRDLLDAVTLLRAQKQRTGIRLIRGTISDAEYTVENARRDQAVLGLMQEIEKLDRVQLSAPMRRAPDLVNLEKLMSSESHLRSTGWLMQGLKKASAVCRLTNGTVFGSGFRCATHTIITNQHVIRDAQSATHFGAEFFFEEDANRRLRVPTRIELDPARLFWSSESLDITVVGTATTPPSDIEILPLTTSQSAELNDRVSIIQHPNGGPKQIATTNNRIINIYTPFLHYLTDTLPGSSGSPVLSDSWEVVAIHHAGGDMHKNARGDVIFANEGVLVAAILSDVTFPRL